MKSIRLRIAAKIVMFVGLAACILGAGTYCVLCMPEVLNIPFDLTYLLIVGCAALIFVLVSLILHVCANTAELSLDEYAKTEDAEEALADIAVNPPEDIQLFPSEEEVEIPEETPEEEEKPEKKSLLPADKVKLIKTAAIVAVPTVLACVIAISSAKKKKRKKIEQERKEKEANRQAFYRWLG